MIGSIILLGAASLMASGVLFKHQRIMVYLGTAAILFEAQWLMLTFLDRVWLANYSATSVYLLGAVLLLIGWGIWYKKWTLPYALGGGSGRRDAVILIVLVVVLASAWLITSNNGYELANWVTHGFYNGDTMTLATLVQRSFLTTGLVDTNPWAGGGDLEYPTLLHAGLAGLYSELGLRDTWLNFLPVLTLLHVLATVPMFFLLWDLINPEPNEGWRKWFGVPSRAIILLGQAAIVLFVMTLSWDAYVYPQGHFWLAGMFMLMLGLLQKGLGEGTRSEWLYVVPGTIIALLLMLANAVTGTAAVTVLALWYLMRAADKKRAVWQRGAWLAAVPVLVALFLAATPGNGAFGIPGFSYTAAGAMVRLGPVLVLLLVAVWLNIERQAFLTLAVTAMFGLALFTFIFSTRNIVVENAERFIYHGLLIGFPLLLAPLIRAFYWVRQKLLYESRSLLQMVTGWGALAALLLLAIWPAGASVASTHDNLLFKDEQRVDLFTLGAMDWINTWTEPDAVFLTSPDTPWVVPMFTGRAILRAQYWLSPADELLVTNKAAWDGDGAAQEELLRLADYLLLRGDESINWSNIPGERVFKGGHVSIWKLAN